MQFTVPAAAFVAFVSCALAQVDGFDVFYKPEEGEVLTAGDSYTISWEAAPAEYDDETVALFLYGGPDGGHLDKVDDIAGKSSC